MTVDWARGWIIRANLYACGIYFSFFVLAPIFGYPLTFDQSIKLLSIIFPVLVGYLATAVSFIFGENRSPEATPKLISANAPMVIKGPVFLFFCLTVILFVAFGKTNTFSENMALGSGMTVDQFSNFFTLLMSLMTGVTGLTIGYLFKIEKS